MSAEVIDFPASEPPHAATAHDIEQEMSRIAVAALALERKAESAAEQRARWRELHEQYLHLYCRADGAGGPEDDI